MRQFIVVRPNQRKISVFEYGDSLGTPVLYFHGWPASHVSAAIYDKIAKRRGIRIIAPDRPGFGASDYQEGRVLLDWPDDVVAIADHLGLKRFSILGVSGGSPYALACAYKIPRRISHIGIVVGPAPVKEYAKGRSFDWRLWLGTIRWVQNILVRIQYINTYYGFSIRAYRFIWGRADRRLYQNAALLKRGHETMKEAFRNGSQGPSHELAIMAKDWGFQLKKIKKFIYLWYGADDYPDIVHMGYFYSDKLPRSKLIVYPSDGHLVSVTRIREILITLYPGAT